MKIKVKVQRHLAIGWLAEDAGDWVFTTCRRGFEEMIGQRLKVGETATVEITGVLTEQQSCSELH